MEDLDLAEMSELNPLRTHRFVGAGKLQLFAKLRTNLRRAESSATACTSQSELPSAAKKQPWIKRDGVSS